MVKPEFGGVDFWVLGFWSRVLGFNFLKGNQVFKWELNNLKPFKSEYACPVFEELVPVVLLALDKFEMDGYAGSFASWESFGNFSYQLLVCNYQLIFLSL